MGAEYASSIWSTWRRCSAMPDGEATDRQTRRPPPSPPAGGAIYGLGLIGALVWFWRQADGVSGHLTAVLKAMVWPAILVYEAFRALRRSEA